MQLVTLHDADCADATRARCQWLLDIPGAQTQDTVNAAQTPLNANETSGHGTHADITRLNMPYLFGLLCFKELKHCWSFKKAFWNP